MQAPVIRTSILPLPLKKSALVSLVAFAAAAALLGGCKKPSDTADADVQTDVRKIDSELRHKPDGSSALASPEFRAITSNKDATPGAQALGHLAAAQAHLSAAEEVFQRIDAQELRLEQLIGSANALVAQVRTNNVAVAGLNAKIDKTKLAAASIDQGAAAAKDGTAGVWLASDTAPIPALSAVDKSVADLTQQSDALKAKQADFEKQKTDALQQAEQVAAKSEAASGKESVDLYKQAAAFRKTAADAGTQSGDTGDKLAAVLRELSVAQAEQTQLQAALTKFGDVSKQVASTAADLQKRIDEVTARSKTIVEGDGAAPAAKPGDAEVSVNSITAAGDQIDQVAQNIVKLRAEASGHLDKADAEFAAAAKLDHDVQGEYKKMVNDSELRTSPLRLAWQWMIDIHNDSNADLDHAAIQQRYARLSADEAYYGAARLATDTAATDAIKAAGLTAPKSLDAGDLADKVKAATATASDSFKKAEDLLDATIARSGSDMLTALAHAAMVDKMIEQYDHWAFAHATGDAEADKYLRASKDLQAQASAIEGLALPTPLPTEIAPAATLSAPTATTPATAPGTPAPATPAPGATTAPSDASAPTPAAAPTTAPGDSPAPAPTTAPAAP